MLAPGTVLFDKYVVDRAIGQGGMASVFAATHLQLHESVAIKILLPEFAQNPTVVQRFLREARAAARLKGEHVTRVIDVGLLPSGPPYMVMELLVGTDLAELLKHHRLLSPPEAVDCVMQACEALAEAHAAGIVHRDIKPSNLFVTRRPDGSPLVKVLDFGISKVGFEDQVTNLTMDSVVGTPSYMSPEQLRGSHDVDARTDIWSLGIVLYRLLAGVRPFTADSISALAIQAATEPTPQIQQLDVPPPLAAIVYRCLEKEAADRYQSVAELAFALAPFAADQRAAAIVMERTQSMLRWTPPGIQHVYVPPSQQQRVYNPPSNQRPVYDPVSRQPVPTPPMPAIALNIPEPTTLGSSAGVVYEGGGPSRRRGLFIGAVAATVIAAAFAIITIVGNKTSNKTDVAPAKPARATPSVEPIGEPGESTERSGSAGTRSAAERRGESIDEQPTPTEIAKPESKPADTVGSKPADTVGSKPADAVGSKPADTVEAKPSDSKPAELEPTKPSEVGSSKLAESKPRDSMQPTDSNALAKNKKTTKPVEAKIEKPKLDTKPKIDTKPKVETKPVETATPVETKPVETKPVETKPKSNPLDTRM